MIVLGLNPLCLVIRECHHLTFYSLQPSIQVVTNQLILAEDWILVCQDDGQVQHTDQGHCDIRIAAVTAHNALLCLRVHVDAQAFK